MRWIIFTLLSALVGVAIFAFIELERHGLTAKDLESISYATITKDELGVPTIVGTSWTDVLRAQGFVIASERLWQMESMRRMAFGELAEVYGKLALGHDRRQVKQGWRRLAEEAKNALPPDELKYCEAYAAGVNDFIAAYPKRLGIEFRLLGVKPKLWQCSDSLGVMLSMASQLSSGAQREWEQSRWRSYLPKAWGELLYTNENPWNAPFYGEPKQVPFPSTQNHLPRRPLEDSEADQVWTRSDHHHYGSNNWAYRGVNGHFVVNDPHLGQSVPQLWYAAKLKVSREEWVVGAAIPGLPGIVLGMNNRFAWAFTNVGEDVDDALVVTLSKDRQSYLHSVDQQGVEHWRPVTRERLEIEVKGEESIVVDAQYAGKYPLWEDPHQPGRFLARRWLLHEEGVLRLPTVAVNRAENWEQFNAAMDAMRAPAQNVLFMDRQGNMGYRASGTGVQRHVTGRRPQPMESSPWVLEPSHARRRFLIREEETDTHWLATANQRIWVDEFGHRWAPDTRYDRIAEVLGSSTQLTLEDMLALQLDTFSRMHKEFASWLIEYASLNGESDFANWEEWSGHIEHDSETFTEVEYAWQLMTNVLVGRLQMAYMPTSERLPLYHPDAKQNWLIALIDDPVHFAAFGTDAQEMAAFLAEKVKARRLRPAKLDYLETNSWQAQHPLANSVAILGRLFTVPTYQQVGHSDVVRVERPHFGATFRFVWDLTQPEKSLWVFPVGQSGHVRSSHFRSFQDHWRVGTAVPVFPNADEWF